MNNQGQVQCWGKWDPISTAHKPRLLYWDGGLVSGKPQGADDVYQQYSASGIINSTASF
jgi:hypothetical protein